MSLRRRRHIWDTTAGPHPLRWKFVSRKQSLFALLAVLTTDTAAEILFAARESYDYYFFLRISIGFVWARAYIISRAYNIIYLHNTCSGLENGPPPPRKYCHNAIYPFRTHTPRPKENRSFIFLRSPVANHSLNPPVGTSGYILW